MIQKLVLKRVMSEEAAQSLKGKFLGIEYAHTVVDYDCDGYDTAGNLLFKFRKNVIPIDLLKAGVEGFKGSVQWTESRGLTSGGSSKRIRKDGSTSNITVGKKVQSGAVGYLDPAAIIPYCRETAFTAKYFDKYQEGVPFVQYVDHLYRELVPEKWKIQKDYALGTNKSYVIADTSFTTVTVNRDFRTAAHLDSGDLPEGMGNLIAYREGDWSGAITMMPEFGVGFDLHNGDIVFFDVHRLHCNSDFVNFDSEKGDLRYSFVIYYRQYMLACPSPTNELKRVKKDKNGFFRL